MNNAKRVLMDAERVLVAFGARRAPYETPEKAATKLFELCGGGCNACNFHSPEGCKAPHESGCSEGFAAWLRSEAPYV